DHARGRHHGPAQDSAWIPRRHRVGEQRTDDRSPDGAGGRDLEALQARLVHVGLVDPLVVRERNAPVGGDQRAGQDDRSRQQQEDPDVREERHDAEPGERKPPPALYGASGGAKSRVTGSRQATAADQLATTYWLALDVWSPLGT